MTVRARDFAPTRLQIGLLHTSHLAQQKAFATDTSNINFADSFQLGFATNQPF